MKSKLNIMLRGIVGGIPLFHSWWENLMSYMTHDVGGTQDAISDLL